MVWFKVDDKAHANTKIRRVLADEPAALALWTVAGSWCADALNDGFVPDHQLPWLMPVGSEELARKLVTHGLWRRVRGGYEFHQWAADGDGTRRNPTREEVEADRRKKAEAGRKGGLNSGKTRSRREARAEPNAVAPAKAPATRLVEPPTRPDPPPSKEGGEGASHRADARGATAPPPRDSPPGPPQSAAAPPADLIAETRAKLRDASRKMRGSPAQPPAARHPGLSASAFGRLLAEPPTPDGPAAVFQPPDYSLADAHFAAAIQPPPQNTNHTEQEKPA